MTLPERLKNCWAKCPRLHRSSVVVGLLVAGVFVLLVIPGEPVEYLCQTTGPPPGYRFYVRHSHGWPWRWYDQQARHDTAVMSPDLFVDRGAPWLTRNAWRVVSTNRRPFAWDRFRASSLQRDLLVGGGVVVLVVGAWEVRRRRRRSAWQVTVWETLVMVTVFAVAFGYCAHLQRIHARDVHHNDILRQLDCLTNLDTVVDWLPEPAWLRRLVGAELVPEWFSHISEVDLMAISTEKVEDVMPHLESLRYLETITIEDAHERPLPVAQFSRLLSLRELQIHEYEPLDDATVEQLKTLKQLDKLSITYASSLSEVARRDLEQALPSCEIVAHSAQ